jgi:hypothetical protein
MTANPSLCQSFALFNRNFTIADDPTKSPMKPFDLALRTRTP